MEDQEEKRPKIARKMFFNGSIGKIEIRSLPQGGVQIHSARSDSNSVCDRYYTRENSFSFLKKIALAERFVQFGENFHISLIVFILNCVRIHTITFADRVFCFWRHPGNQDIRQWNPH